jgi:Phage portal protein
MEKLNTPRGAGARSMTTLSPSTVNVSYGSPTENFTCNGPDWMGPLTPMLPIAPKEVAGRQWDFVPGFNLLTEPRASEPVTFAMLRMLAESFDPVRLIIERRKDQLCRMPWTIRQKHDEDGRRPSSTPAIRNTIREVKNFFKKPTYELSFRDWLRILLEDHFVIDAPTLFCERDRAGSLLYLQPMDGGLIKRVIDSWGRTPRPIPWDGNPVDWNGLTITAENFHTQGFKYDAKGAWLLPPAYQQILKGLPAVDYTTQDIIYKPMNLRSHSLYGFSPVEQILTTVNIAMRRSASQLEYFKEGNQPEALFSLPESWTPDQIGRFQDYFDSMYSGNLANRRKLKFIAGGSRDSYVAIKEPPLKNEFDEWLVRIACFAFSYPPAAFVSLSNRSIAEQHAKTGEEEGLQSTKLFVADLINGVIENDFDAALEFTWVEEEEIDQKIESEILSTYVSNGILTINQAREKLGEQPDADPAANKLMIKTQTGYTPIGNITTTSEIKE